MQNDNKAPGGGAGLPRDVQEHLGRRLRTEFQVEAEKPSFLGEPAVPPQFETLVRKLEAGQQGERQGYEAVKRAILGEEAHAPPPKAAAPPRQATPLRPKIPKRPI